MLYKQMSVQPEARAPVRIGQAHEPEPSPRAEVDEPAPTLAPAPVVAQLPTEGELLTAELRRLMPNLQRVVTELENKHRQQRRDLETWAVEIGLLTAEKLLLGPLDLERPRMLELVREALRRFPTAPTEIRLHPDDLVRIRDLCEPDMERLNLLPDETVERGNCWLRSGDIGLRSDIAVALADIRRELLSSTGANEEPAKSP